ncbi:MAG: EVE domain-containing protein [Myxococcales bacterium]|nr:EVE domain-containing protein [Myxococcales bacterium]
MASRKRRYWLMKSEPETYSIEDLARDGRTMWDGVRNYQARNFMRDDMRAGDLVLFYHSNAKPMGVAGVAEVVGEPYPDPTQFDPKSKYHDPASSPDAPTWILVDVAHVETLPQILPLAGLKDDPKLEGMPLLQKGQRLSVQPVDKAHFKRVLSLAKAKTKVRG